MILSPVLLAILVTVILAVCPLAVIASYFGILRREALTRLAASTRDATEQRARADAAEQELLVLRHRVSSYDEHSSSEVRPTGGERAAQPPAAPTPATEAAPRATEGCRAAVRIAR